LEADKIPSIKTETDKIQGACLDVAGIKSMTAFIKKIEGGKWQVLDDEMVFYDEDNVTVVARFDITKDAEGNPIMRTRL